MKGTPRRNGGVFEYVQLPLENPPLPRRPPKLEDVERFAIVTGQMSADTRRLDAPSPEQRTRSELADELGLNEHNRDWFVECLIRADEADGATPTPYQRLKAKIMAGEAEKTKE
jgi:hypothetical protein